MKCEPLSKARASSTTRSTASCAVPRKQHDLSVIRRYLRAYLHCWKTILHFVCHAKRLERRRNDKAWAAWCKRWFVVAALAPTDIEIFGQFRQTGDYDTHQGIVEVAGEVGSSWASPDRAPVLSARRSCGVDPPEQAPRSVAAGPRRPPAAQEPCRRPTPAAVSVRVAWRREAYGRGVSRAYAGVTGGAGATEGAGSLPRQPRRSMHVPQVRSPSAPPWESAG
jgi:hypothetical protein